MTRLLHNPPDAPPTFGGYSQGLEVSTPGRLLYISGQIPENVEGEAPDGFREQCRQVWRNIKSVLASAGMMTSDLVKVTTFLHRGPIATRIRRSAATNSTAPIPPSP